ncbi:MAG: acyl carrier protein [Holophagaceae bacterium]|uniref:Acyl carrier protein n=1 Tax=Candidatus Geothrix skivensis TaxID=2954439 RepID=A0A9D7SFP1_9BACT|nr:acyl carrier protein [Candidatus Geothrix skivensis]
MTRPVDPFKEGQAWPADVPGQINHILVRLFELEAAAVTAEARMKEDLDLDSLDAVEVVVAIERRFGFIADEERVAKMRTVGEIHAYVEAMLARASS